MSLSAVDNVYVCLCRHKNVSGLFVHSCCYLVCV